MVNDTKHRVVSTDKKAVFALGIQRIIAWCAQKQVVWSNAFRIVAMVANKESFWHRPVVQFPRISMRVNCRRGSEPTIVLGLVSGPFPTAFAFGHITPKPSRYWRLIRACSAFFTATFKSAGFGLEKLITAFAFPQWKASGIIVAFSAAIALPLISGLVILPTMWTLFKDHTKPNLSMVQGSAKLVTSASNFLTLPNIPLRCKGHV